MYWQRFKTLEQRFSEKYTSRAGECWPWKTQGRGLPQFWNGTRHERASRTAYRIHVGEIPAGMHVLHRCDNPQCVNPEHLFLGTHDANMADKKAKGRQHRPRGELNGRARLSAEDRMEIGQLRYAGLSQQAVATIYGVGQATISHLERGTTWRSEYL